MKLKKTEPLLLESIKAHFLYLKSANDLSISTYQTYEGTYNFYSNYLKKDAKLSDLTEDFFYQLVIWAKKKDYAMEYIKRKVNHIRPVIQRAIRDGYLRYDVSESPMKAIKAKKKNDSETALSKLDIDKIKSYNCPREFQFRKDVLLLQIDTGMAFSDIMNCKIHKLKKETVNGNPVTFITGYRNKTKSAFVCELKPEFVPVYEKLKKQQIDYPNYRTFLIKVKKECDITIDLTSHVARYTFVQQKQNEGYSNEVIALHCGHSSTQMIDKVYGKISMQRVMMEVKRLAK